MIRCVRPLFCVGVRKRVRFKVDSSGLCTPCEQNWLPFTTDVGEQTIGAHLSSNQNPGSLLYIGDYTTQLYIYRDYNGLKGRIPMNQSGFNGMSTRGLLSRCFIVTNHSLDHSSSATITWEGGQPTI